MRPKLKCSLCFSQFSIKKQSVLQSNPSNTTLVVPSCTMCWCTALGACTHLARHSHSLFLPDKNSSSLLKKNPLGDPGANLGFVRPCESALKLWHCHNRLSSWRTLLLMSMSSVCCPHHLLGSDIILRQPPFQTFFFWLIWFCVCSTDYLPKCVHSCIPIQVETKNLHT